MLTLCQKGTLGGTSITYLVRNLGLLTLLGASASLHHRKRKNTLACCSRPMLLEWDCRCRTRAECGWASERTAVPGKQSGLVGKGGCARTYLSGSHCKIFGRKEVGYPAPRGNCVEVDGEMSEELSMHRFATTGGPRKRRLAWRTTNFDAKFSARQLASQEDLEVFPKLKCS